MCRSFNRIVAFSNRYLRARTKSRSHARIQPEAGPCGFVFFVQGGETQTPPPPPSAWTSKSGLRARRRNRARCRGTKVAGGVFTVRWRWGYYPDGSKTGQVSNTGWVELPGSFVRAHVYPVCFSDFLMHTVLHLPCADQTHLSPPQREIKRITSG